MAPHIDHLHYFVIITTMTVSTLIGVAALAFYVKYRWKGRIGAKGEPVYTTFLGETLIIGVPAFFFLLWFAIGYRDFVRLQTPPANSMDVYVMGKQWMWKFAYPEGPNGVNVLRVPAQPSGAPAHDLARRHPLVLRAGVPHQAGRPARALHRDLVRGDDARPLSDLLHRDVRHRPLDDARRGHRDGAERLRQMVRRPARPVAAAPEGRHQDRHRGSRSARHHDRDGAQARRARGLLQVPLRRRLAAHRSDVARHVPAQGDAAGRRAADRRRGVPHRVDDGPEGEAGAGLPARHAELPRAPRRAGVGSHRRVHQVAPLGQPRAGA